MSVSSLGPKRAPKANSSLNLRACPVREDLEPAEGREKGEGVHEHSAVSNVEREVECPLDARDSRTDGHGASKLFFRSPSRRHGLVSRRA